MLNERLYLNNIEVFLTSETVISLIYQINDIAELKDRQANYSNTFKLPMNAVNRSIWEDAERPNSNTNLPYRKVPARYIKGGLEIIPDGYAVLERATNFYQVTIYSGNLVFFDLLGETKLAELDFSDLDQTWNETNIIANWNAIDPTTNPGLIWALIDYGGLSTTGADYAIDRLLPSLTIKTIMDRIFAKYGFNYAGSFPDCTEFSRLILPCVGGTLQHDAAWVTDKLFLAKLNAALTTNTENAFYKIPFQNDSTGGAFDNGDHYDELNYEVIIDESMYANHLLTVTTAVLFVPSSGSAPLLELYSNLNGANTLQGSHSVDGTYSYSTGYANLKKGDKICWKIKANCQIKVDVTTEFSNQVANKLIFGSSLQIGGIVPEITIYDFIKGMMQMYCVLCSNDPATSTIYFNFFDDIPANKPLAKDWSDKLHMDKSTWEVGYRNSTYAQKNNIKYLDDVSGGVPEGYGDGFFTIDDETLLLEKDLFTLPFAASTSHLVATWDVNILAISRGADTGFDKNVKPRICYMEHLEVNLVTYIAGVFSNSYSFGVDFDSVPYGRFKQVSVVPAAGNANGSKDDFRLGINDSLIDDHFQGIVSVLQQFKMFTGLFKINENDISELNHFIPVYLKQFASYFYLNQINGFKGDALTKSILVKLGDKTEISAPSIIPECRDLVFTVDGSVFSAFAIVTPIGNTINIKWGDGNIQNETGTGSAEYYSHAYAIPGTYDIIVCAEGIEYFEAESQGIQSVQALPSSLTELELTDNDISSIDLSNCPLLVTMALLSNNLTNIDISSNPLLYVISLGDNKLTVVAVNNFLIAIDGFGLIGGNSYTKFQTPPAPPSGAGSTAKANLIGKGWSCTTD